MNMGNRCQSHLQRLSHVDAQIENKPLQNRQTYYQNPRYSQKAGLDGRLVLRSESGAQKRRQFGIECLWFYDDTTIVADGFIR